MADTRLVKAKCKCGAILTFTDGPLGYKTVCETCGATVRLKPESIRPKRKKKRYRRGLPPSAAITCPCGHLFVVRAHPVGTLLTCPACKSYLRMPDAKRPKAGGPTVEVLESTVEIGAEEHPTPAAEKPLAEVQTQPPGADEGEEPLAEILPDDDVEPSASGSLDALASDELLDFADLEGWQPEAAGASDSGSTFVCPACRSEMPQRPQRCPHCGVDLST